MARQPALALARPRGVPCLSGRWRRAVLIAVCAVAVLGLLYLGARETPVFALRTVEVEGAPADVRQAILQSLEETRGKSLVSLDGDAVVRRLEALPSVQSVTYDRAFPHTLRLVVCPRSRWRSIERRTGTLDRLRARTRHRRDERRRGTRPATDPLPAPSDLADRRRASWPTRGRSPHPRWRFPRRRSDMLLPIHSARLEDGELTFVLAGEGETRPLLLTGRADRRGDETARCGTGSAEARTTRNGALARVSRRYVARSTSRFQLTLIVSG